MKRAINIVQDEEFGFSCRWMLIDGEPWLFAADVCRSLGMANASMAVSRLEPNDRRKVDIHTSGGAQPVNLISEPGYYELVMSGRSAECDDRRRGLFKSLSGKGLHVEVLARLAAETDPQRLADSDAKTKTVKNGRRQARRHRAEVFMRDGRRCVYCGSHENLQLDHIVPVVHDGGHDIENLQTLCRSCNLSKGAKL